jgi:class 3 adenylate cyclase
MGRVRDDESVDADLRGTVTFLFTDIEGSTDLWDRDPVAMDRALRVHDGLVESAITDRAGVVFSRAGDSFAAAFASASEALVAAVAIQRAIASQPAPIAAAAAHRASHR